MKDWGPEYLSGREGVQLLGLLSFYLEQEQRFQPQEKGLSLIEATPEINVTEFFYWKELVSKCLAEYSSPECCKPDLKKLVWIVSRCTAQNLHSSYYSVPELPTLPDGGCFDGSESEDSCEDMSCGEESLGSSPPSDQECSFFFDFKVAQTLCFPS
ncbi:Cyclin-G2 [Fukomys damarensis]|uniref:Cyclin-G2 n=1 Tax=Fukomys damarensis TaxID=885580 RepID=A0A091D6H0_FUKDA|nr:Cyclin-G2 [Fukomys damarensis]